MRMFAVRTPMFGMLLAASILATELVGAVVYRQQRAERAMIEDQASRIEAVRHELRGCEDRLKLRELDQQQRQLEQQIRDAERAVKRQLDDELLLRMRHTSD